MGSGADPDSQDSHNLPDLDPKFFSTDSDPDLNKAHFKQINTKNNFPYLDKNVLRTNAPGKTPQAKNVLWDKKFKIR